jgi:putative DNA primase/helicase
MPITSANRIVAQPVSWLWPGRIPLGKLTILDGNPDLGKSLLSLDWCARLSTGRAFPDCESAANPASALVLSAEDAPGDTIVPRLEGLGADMSRVFIWQRKRADEDWPWRFPRDLRRLDAALRRTGARLAVLEPLMAFLDHRWLYNDAGVRQVLGPLMQVAEKHQCALLLHRHLNKQGRGHALYRGLGSIAFMAACRYAMLVERDPDDGSRCVLAPVRHSLAPAQPSLVYRITGAEGALPTVSWLGRSAYTANELLAHARLEGKPRDQAADFLERFLAASPRTSSAVKQAAHKAGIAYRTLERAKDGLGIRSQRVYRHGQPVSYWLLDDQELGPGDYDDYVIDQMIRKLRAGVPLEASKPMRVPTHSSKPNYNPTSSASAPARTHRGGSGSGRKR